MIVSRKRIQSAEGKAKQCDRIVMAFSQIIEAKITSNATIQSLSRPRYAAGLSPHHRLSPSITARISLPVILLVIRIVHNRWKMSLHMLAIGIATGK
jgi:hypothetical protein